MNSLRLCSLTLLFYQNLQKQKQVTESMNKYLQDYKVLQDDEWILNLLKSKEYILLSIYVYRIKTWVMEPHSKRTLF